MMQPILLLRLEAPMMSFGGVAVDHHNPTDRFPATSLLAGLLANALGYSHSDTEALESLQARIRYAARWDVDPVSLRDYQTVDLGQPHLAKPGWTTRGKPEHRDGGPDARFGTHQRYRHYWADGVMTVALTLTPGNPDLEAVAAALAHPARPLFIGRKNCLPSSRLLLGVRSAEDLLDALRAEPLDPRAGDQAVSFEACWPQAPNEVVAMPLREMRSSLRNWRLQVHTDAKPMVIGHIEVPTCT